MMRIIIDMQGAQAENRHRGIGKYTVSLVRSMLKNSRGIEFFLVFNARFDESIDELKKVFLGLIPIENIRIWYPAEKVSGLNLENEWIKKACELTREAFILNLSPSVVLLTSLFEGLVDDAVTSVGNLDERVPTAVVLYDLIPYINPELYLTETAVKSWYFDKIKYLRRADLVLSISESSKREAVEYLGFDAESVVNISAAVDECFRPIDIKGFEKSEILSRFGITSEFVMYTGGIDHRKNVEGLISAYSRLDREQISDHQLVIVCKVSSQETVRLNLLASKLGLPSGRVVFTGFVTEGDLIALYNLCKVFIFPSWHEGFGLPALEAMSCGKPVIAACTSSLPEVVGNKHALFDPFDEASMTSKLTQVLVDDVFRQALAEKATEQSCKFSWDQSATCAATALKLLADASRVTEAPLLRAEKRRLAYISPLPPARSGISDYSAELLPELALHYNIDVIVDQDKVDSIESGISYNVRSVDWFRKNYSCFDRVIYHFGNSSFHQHMFELLPAYPGVVVLHDFYLSGIIAHMEYYGDDKEYWTRELYLSHGYAAVQKKMMVEDKREAIWAYPCNYSVLESAQGVIVHSRGGMRLAQSWYGADAGQDWVEIPLLRVPKFISQRVVDIERAKLGIAKDSFVVCSFGLLGPSKLNDRLLDSWLASDLCRDPNCFLVFVGENSTDHYGDALERRIKESNFGGRIRITGWASNDTFQSYLTAANVGVQLRTLSRGETSAAVLDCMNYGLATIVNANGSMADIPDGAVFKLPDQFTNQELIDALEALRFNSELCSSLGKSGQRIVHELHSPRKCAKQYSSAIEQFYSRLPGSVNGIAKSISALECVSVSSADLSVVANMIDKNIDHLIHQKQLFVDVSELVNRDAKSGIQRVVRCILAKWLVEPPSGFRVEPVYASLGAREYRYARRFTLGFMGVSPTMVDESISFRRGDVFLGLDLQPEIVPSMAHVFKNMRAVGVKVEFVVYDLLLKTFAHCFPVGAADLMDKWLATVALADRAICISKSVADELNAWLEQSKPSVETAIEVDWFHLGADINVEISDSSPPEMPSILSAQLQSRPTFLMVGTLEPRKGHHHVIDAFTQLWSEGVDVNLVIVGKKGWMIDELVQLIEKHPEKNARLYWLESISDKFLDEVYSASSCLIAASYGEGFGLPLIEAAQHNIPLFVRDIPVFREVAGTHACYFSSQDALSLSREIKAWLSLFEQRLHPRSSDMPWLTWQQSADQLSSTVLRSFASEK